MLVQATRRPTTENKSNNKKNNGEKNNNKNNNGENVSESNSVSEILLLLLTKRIKLKKRTFFRVKMIDAKLMKFRLKKRNILLNILYNINMKEKEYKFSEKCFFKFRYC